MDVDQYTPLVREAAEAFASKGPTDQVLAKLREAKQVLTDHAWALQRANTAIDALAANLLPNAVWDYAAGDYVVRPVVAAATRQSVTSAERNQRVNEIANTKIAAGATTVNTKEIAQQLQLEGDDKPLSSLATAVGNILSRTDAWHRIRRNVYRPFEEVVNSQ